MGKETQGIKELVGDAFAKTKDIGKNFKEIVKDLSISDVENAAKIAFSSIESKVGSWNFTEKLETVKNKTENYYHSITGTAKSPAKPKKSTGFVDDSKLEENEDEFLLDPQHKSRQVLYKYPKM